MKSLVTGGAGCIGSELVGELLRRGKVTVIDNLSSGKTEHIESFFGNKNFRFVEMDITQEEIGEPMEGIDAVFHLAANPDIKFLPGDPTNKDLKQNTIATHSVLDSMRKNKVRRIVFSSSSVVYGKAEKIPTPEDYGPLMPTSLYGASKLACEGLITSYCNMFEMKGWIFRFANIVGDRSRKKGRTVISDFIFKLRQNPEKLEILGDGKQWKSYLLADECVGGMLFALDNAASNINIFNLGNVDSISVDAIAEIVCGEMGLRPKLEYSGGGSGWAGDINRFLLDISKMKALGWSPKHDSAESVRIAAQRMLAHSNWR